MRNPKKGVPVLLLVVLLPALLQAAYKLPAPEKLVLKNGLTVYIQKNSDLPLVSFRMNIRGGGSAYEPAELEGLANLTAELMLKGTVKMSAEAVAEALDFVGADLSISATEEFASVGGDSLSEHFPKLMEIAADCLINPAFQEEEFRKERDRRIDSTKAVKDNPGAAVRYYFQKGYFGSHPMGHLAMGTETSLKKMTTEDVKKFYRVHFRPDLAVASIVGDIDKGKLKAILDGTIGRWKTPGTPAPSLSLPALPQVKGQKLILIDKPDATQAYFALGSPGYAMGDKITPQAAVMNTLFGGRFTSWMNTELRIKRGLTYGANSSFQSWLIGGLFRASSYTRNEKIGEMLDITFGLLKKAGEEGFSSDEVTSARNYILGQFPPTLETNSSKAGAFVSLASYGLGFDYYDKYLAEVDKVSDEEAKHAAGKLIPQGGFVLVVVGKASEIRDQLKKYGSWQEKKITDPGF